MFERTATDLGDNDAVETDVCAKKMPSCYLRLLLPQQHWQ